MRIKNWDAFLFIAGYHVLLLALLPFVIGALSWASFVVFLITFLIGGISITAGYHRLFSHKAYKAHPAYEWVVLILSTLSVQWSALMWSHDHRLHHKHVDTEQDPYSIKKGFWYAHILWMFRYQRDFDSKVVPDLLKNKRVVFQDRYYLPLALAVNGAVFGVACLFMSPFAALYSGVLLRICAIHHCTWFINSLAHTWGSKTYAKELTAVDNHVLAFLTFGEGYHNYHHAFAGDYRNGIRWYHFDPTKWLVWVMARVGLVEGLRTVNEIRVRKELVIKDKTLLLSHLSGELDDLAAELRGKLEELSTAYETRASALMEKMRELRKVSDEQRSVLLVEIRQLRRELRAQWKAWLALTDIAVRQYHVAHQH